MALFTGIFVEDVLGKFIFVTKPETSENKFDGHFLKNDEFSNLETYKAKWSVVILVILDIYVKVLPSL